MVGFSTILKAKKGADDANWRPSGTRTYTANRWFVSFCPYKVIGLCVWNTSFIQIGETNENYKRKISNSYSSPFRRES